MVSMIVETPYANTRCDVVLEDSPDANSSGGDSSDIAVLQMAAELAIAEEKAAAREVAAKKAVLKLEQARRRSSQGSAGSRTTGKNAVESGAPVIAPPTTVGEPDRSTTLEEDLERMIDQDLGTHGAALLTSEALRKHNEAIPRPNLASVGDPNVELAERLARARREQDELEAKQAQEAKQWQMVESAMESCRSRENEAAQALVQYARASHVESITEVVESARFAEHELAQMAYAREQSIVQELAFEARAYYSHLEETAQNQHELALCEMAAKMRLENSLLCRKEAEQNAAFTAYEERAFIDLEKRAERRLRDVEVTAQGRHEE